jgi:SpoIID/LytB domain protein
VAAASGKVVAANSLGRQSYLQGVVPREMPASWHAEALQAQATAARTYSLAVAGHCTWNGAPAFCATTSDQVYGGRSAETAATNSAVTATAGKAVTYGGSPIPAYFFSTSGGRTASIAEEWGGSPVSYLVPVNDPYDSISPHHRWGPLDAETDCDGTARDCVFSGAQIQAKLGLAVTPTDLRVTARNGSNRVAALRATAGGTTTFTGTQSRTKLGLRSTWFFVGALSIKASSGTVTRGTTVTLSGLARRGNTAGWGSALLQRRSVGATKWTTIGKPLPDGAWSRVRRPTVTTDFRVLTGNAATSPKRVVVRP